jgi:outer membrane murein-binding lipoprotein Lpp
MVVEIWAAVAGASIGVAASGLKGASRESQQGRDSLVRLTSAVDNLSAQVDLFRREQAAISTEVFARLSDAERAIARLQGITDRN